ncbi:MAG TPA: Uma2 family endonuclease [Chloroflexota bacterium]|nr:Uma2 family endonuclease [Chloroflexota bacterium]
MAVEVVPAVEVRKKLTPDDVLEMSLRGDFDGATFELVDGELVELSAGNTEHDSAAANVLGPLWVFSQHAGGRAVGATLGLRVGVSRSNVRVPDAGYIAPERARAPGRHFLDGAPDLVVEVLSQGQYGEAYVKGKIREYFEAGARLGGWCQKMPI